MGLIEITRLSKILYSNKKLLETQFPELIRRLITNSINNNTFVYLPSGDDTALHGWDGIIKNNKIDHRFIPLGNSYLEIGTNDKYREKIIGDFNSRNNDETILNKDQATYIAISSKIINNSKKQEIINELNVNSKFKEIKILDLSDIKSWLDEHLNILLWLLKLFNQNVDIYDICLLEDEFKRITIVPDKKDSTELYTISNEKEINQLKQGLNDKNKIISIKSDYGKDFSLNFCIVALFNSDNIELKEKTFIVNNQNAMNFINLNCENKIIIVNFNCRDERFLINQRNTYIFLDSFENQENFIKLNHLDKNDIIKQIEKLGYPYEKANYLAFISGYNPITLRRYLSNSPTIHIPSWVRKTTKDKLIPLLLLGEIDFENEKYIELLNILGVSNIDDFIIILNEWLDFKDSPLFKSGSHYKFSSRKEGFDYIRVELFMNCVKNLENFILDSFKNVQNIKNLNGQIFNNIIDGFIILSSQNYENKNHFDDFTTELFDNLNNNISLIFYASSYFYKLVELDSYCFVNFCKKLLDNKDLLNELIKYSNSKTCSNEFFEKLSKAINYSIKLKDYSEISLSLLIKLYYLTNNSIICNLLVDDLSYLTSISGNVPIKFKKKIEIFLENSKNENAELTKNIIIKLFNSNSCFIAVNNSYIECKKEKEELFFVDLNNTYLNLYIWLNNNSSIEDKINYIKLILGKNAYDELLLSVFKNEVSSQIDMILKENDEYKSKLLKILLMCRNLISSKNIIINLDLESYLENEINKIKFNDEYIKLKDVIIDDFYPVIKRICDDEKNDFKLKSELKWNQKEEALKKILKLNNKNLYKLIDDYYGNNKIIWNVIYDLTNNHIEIIKYIIENKMIFPFNEFIRCFTDDELIEVLKITDLIEFIVKNVTLFNPIIYKFVDKKPLEENYWKNLKFPNLYEYKNDFEYLFNKFIKFAPLNLMNFFAYEKDKIDLKLEEKFLEAIIKAFNEDMSYYEFDDDLFRCYFEKLDELKDNDKISELELKLLPIIMKNIDIPRLIKNYFSKYPAKLSEFLESLLIEEPNFEKDDYRFTILCSCRHSFDSFDFVDLTSIKNQNKSFKIWVDEFLNIENNGNIDLITLFFNCVLKIASDHSNYGDIWPSNDVADGIEFLLSFCKKYNMDEKEFKNYFVCCFNNVYEARRIDDGSNQFEKAQLFKKYANLYKPTHSNTSEILELISSNYYDSGKEEKNEII